MSFLIAYYVSWTVSLGSVTLVVGAVDHHSGLERGLSRDMSEWDEEEVGLLGLDPFAAASPTNLSFSTPLSPSGASGTPGKGKAGSGRGAVFGSGGSSRLSEGGGGGAVAGMGSAGEVTPYRHHVVNGLRTSPATPGVPRVDSSDRIYQQLHEPFMRKMEQEKRVARLAQ